MKNTTTEQNVVKRMEKAIEPIKGLKVIPSEHGLVKVTPEKETEIPILTGVVVLCAEAYGFSFVSAYAHNGKLFFLFSDKEKRGKK